MIHFNPNLVSQAIKIAHEAQELSDVLNDLNRINAALSAVTSIENLIRARMLDKELREKYSTFAISLISCISKGKSSIAF